MLSAPNGSSRHSAESVNILIVDDEIGMRQTLSEIIATMGYQADTAESGAEALRKFRERFYNLALLDIRLPDRSGTELLAELQSINQEQQRDPPTLFIMATGFASVQ